MDRPFRVVDTHELSTAGAAHPNDIAFDFTLQIAAAAVLPEEGVEGDDQFRHIPWPTWRGETPSCPDNLVFIRVRQQLNPHPYLRATSSESADNSHTQAVLV